MTDLISREAVLGTNPRFVAWAKAHGHTPETVLDHLPIHEFPIWNRNKLAEYSHINPSAFTCGGLTDHDAYDAWLAHDETALTPSPVDASQTPDPVVNEHDDPVCTCCGGTGITLQTECRCACQTPDPNTKMRCAECWCDGGECEWIATGNETTPDPVVNDPRVKALVTAATALRDQIAYWHDGGPAAGPDESKALFEALDAALRAIGGEA